MLTNEQKQVICFIKYMNQKQKENYKEDIDKAIPELNWINVYKLLKEHTLFIKNLL